MKRICIGHQGHIDLCQHETITWHEVSLARKRLTKVHRKWLWIHVRHMRHGAEVMDQRDCRVGNCRAVNCGDVGPGVLIKEGNVTIPAMRRLITTMTMMMMTLRIGPTY